MDPDAASCAWRTSRRVAGRDPAVDRERRRRSGGLAHRHALAIDRTDAWASWLAEKQRPATRTFVGVADDERPVRDPDGAALRAGRPSACPAPPWWSSIGAPHRPIWSSNGARLEDVVAGQPRVAIDPARLADADLRAECESDACS